MCKVLWRQSRKFWTISSLVDWGYDGAATILGNKAGVAKRISKDYPKALYVHCHRPPVTQPMTKPVDIGSYIWKVLLYLLNKKSKFNKYIININVLMY